MEPRVHPTPAHIKVCIGEELADYCESHPEQRLPLAVWDLVNQGIARANREHDATKEVTV